VDQNQYILDALIRQRADKIGMPLPSYSGAPVLNPAGQMAMQAQAQQPNPQLSNPMAVASYPHQFMSEFQGIPGYGGPKFGSAD
jgi:hypothetical protein